MFKSHSYLKNRGEPRDKPSRDLLPKDETVLVEDSPIMRRRFRHIAQRIRVIKIHGINKQLSD